MKIKLFTAGLFLTALAFTSVAEAQTKTPVINYREHSQERRINHGVKNGELTKNETHNLRKDEKTISNEKRLAKSDGMVTHGEKKMIRHQENRDSRAIYRKKHNTRVR